MPWRRLVVRSDVTLDELSAVLEAAMGWSALADPSHPEHEEVREWAPWDVDPEHFDVEETTLAMRSPRPSFDW